MTKFNATIEYIRGGAAIITLTDSSGEWCGAGRIEVRSGSESALYEAGYNDACARATAHGGTLQTYRVAR